MIISGLSTIKGTSHVFKNPSTVLLQHKSSYVAERVVKNKDIKFDTSFLNKQTRTSVKTKEPKMPDHLFEQASDMKRNKFLAPKKEILSFEEYLKAYPNDITPYEQYKIDLSFQNVPEDTVKQYYKNYLTISYNSYKARFSKGPNPYALL